MDDDAHGIGGQQGEDGRRDFAAYRRWKGREFTKLVAEFGECVTYAPTLPVGKGKFDVRWREGVWLGIRPGSGWASGRERRVLDGDR